jgi:hypothetical protein
MATKATTAATGAASGSAESSIAQPVDGAQAEEGEVEGEGEEGDEEGEEQAEEGPPQPAPLPIPGTFKRRPSKRFSVVAAEGNPLAQNQAGAKMASGKMISVKVENISDARPITTDELADAVKKISLFE